ncbi:hypothetical protein [Photobacterium nomapromontoriensis]|uniref:hypothetical protein n=1 Tax=Photobacterium nomapromontoriensis TaxID=2910237 RepID=UPI003D138B2E
MADKNYRAVRANMHLTALASKKLYDIKQAYRRKGIALRQEDIINAIIEGVPDDAVDQRIDHFIRAKLEQPNILASLSTTALTQGDLDELAKRIEQYLHR